MSFFNLNRPNHRRYVNFDCRLDTFSNWASLHLCQSAESMALAGFFRCNEINDCVQCHVCNVRIHAWVPSDEALSEHEKWSPFCPFVKLRKSQMLALLVYILPLITNHETQSMVRRDPGLCTKCTIDPINVEFWPCQHRVICSICAISIIRCPRCHIFVSHKNRINDEWEILPATNFALVTFDGTAVVESEFIWVE